jgi:hypothetical protein
LRWIAVGDIAFGALSLHYRKENDGDEKREEVLHGSLPVPEI